MITDTERIKTGVDLVFPAGEAAALTREVVKRRQEQSNHKVGFGTAELDKYLIPSWPGDLVLICGRPQNYKTGYMQTLMHKAANDIVTQQKVNECVILITWEVSVEQAMAYWLAVESGISATDMMRGEIGLEWEKFDAAIAKVSSAPVYIIGHSIGRDSDKKRRRPHLPPSVINVALDYLMNDMGLEPRMITMDYLQRIHTERGGRVDRNEHYLQCIDWAKDTAIWAGSAVYLGTQARREVDDQSIRIPGLRDSQWSSNAEQSADKFLSLWMPKQSFSVGDSLNLGGGLGEITVTENLLLLAASKQKFGPAGKIFPLFIDPEHLSMKDAYLPSLKKGYY